MATSKPNIAELVAQMPATDKEKEALKAAAQQPDQPKPKSDKPVGSKFDAPDPDAARRIGDAILAGGRASLVELIGLIRDPASEDFQDYKAEYLCHCLTLQVGAPDRAEHRRLFIDTLVSQIGNDALPAHTRGFLVRELEWIGDGAAVTALGRLLADERFCDDAARALLAIKEGVVELFRKALAQAAGRCRLVALQSLAALRDPASSGEFLKGATDGNREIRLAAVWGLARLAAAESVPTVLKAAETRDTWERIKTTQACLLLAENLAAGGRKTDAVKIYTHLRDTRAAPKERYVREIADKALEKLGAGRKLT